MIQDVEELSNPAQYLRQLKLQTEQEVWPDYTLTQPDLATGNQVTSHTEYLTHLPLGDVNTI